MPDTPSERHSPSSISRKSETSAPRTARIFLVSFCSRLSMSRDVMSWLNSLRSFCISSRFCDSSYRREFSIARERIAATGERMSISFGPKRPAAVLPRFNTPSTSSPAMRGRIT